MNIKRIIKNYTPGLYIHLQEKVCELRYVRRKLARPNHYPKLLEKRFEKLVGQKMDIKYPITYSQKIQWLKLYDPNPLRSQLTDKIAVRDWIRDKIGEEYLIPIYGIYDKFDDIDFDKLPKSFVIKTNHSSGWNIVVKDKNNFNIKEGEKKINKWLSLNYAFWSEYEIHYSKIAPRILIEKYMEDSTGNLTDYKFLCFAENLNLFGSIMIDLLIINVMYIIWIGNCNLGPNIPTVILRGVRNLKISSLCVELPIYYAKDLSM